MLRTAFQKASEALKKHLVYSEKVDERVPFSVSIEADGGRILLLPANFEDLIVHKVWGPLCLLIVENWIGKFDQVSTNVNIQTTTEEDRLMWLGFSNRLSFPFPESGYKFSTVKGSPQTLGRALADAEIYLANGNTSGASFDYLPESVKFAKSKRLNAMMYTLTGMPHKKVADAVLLLISRIAKQKVKNDENAKKAFAAFKIPLATIVNRLTQKKKTESRKDGRTIIHLVPVHVSRPSTFVEVLTTKERTFLKSLEAPWDELKRLSDENKSGLISEKIEDFTSRWKVAYAKTFEIAKKLNAWRAIRRKSFEKYLPKGKKARRFKTTDIESFFEWLVAPIDNRNFSTEDLEIMNFGNLTKCFGEAYEFNQFTRATNLVTPGSVYKAMRILRSEDFKRLEKDLDWIPDGTLSRFIGLRQPVPEERDREEMAEQRVE